MATTTLILDNFTDTDAVDLSSHTIGPTNTPATGWGQSVGSSFSIAGNRAKAANAFDSNGRYAACDAGRADLILSAICNLATDQGGAVGMGVLARFTDANNLWKIEFYAFFNAFRITERNGAVETVRASAALTPTLGVDYTIVATLGGSTISATLNGSNSISYGSATLNQATTSHGLALSAANGPGTATKWDDFTASFTYQFSDIYLYPGE